MRLRGLILPVFSGLLVAVACDSPGVTDVMEPSFGKVDTIECDAVSQEQLDGLFALIDEVYAAAPNSTRTSVKSHVENIAREVCQGDYAQAIKMTWSALQQIDQQIGDLVVESSELDPDDLGDLWTQIFALACTGHEDACIVVPGGAFLSTGGIGSVNPRRGGAVLTRNGEAAAVADGDDFSGRDDVFLILSRIPQSELLEGLVPGYSSYEEGYQVIGSEDADPGADGGVLIQMCVLDILPGDLTPYDLQLGHVFEGGAFELLTPIFDGLIIEDACFFATAEATSPPSGWLGSLGRFASATFQKVFGPEPLRARRGPGVGLGGRAGTFSPFVPMYPYQPLSVVLSGNGSGEVQFVDSDGNTITCVAGGDCPDETFPVGDQVELTATADEGSAFVGWTGDCAVDVGDPTQCTATIDKDGVGVTAIFEKATTPLYVDVTNLGTTPLTVSIVEFQVGESDGTLLKTCSVAIDQTDEPGFGPEGCDVPEALIGTKVVFTATPVGVTGPWDMEFTGGCSYYESLKGEGSVSCTIPVLPEAPETISILYSH